MIFVIVYVLGLVIYPVIYGFINPPYDIPLNSTSNVQPLDTFSLVMQALFWPFVLAWYIVVGVLALSLNRLVEIGQRFRRAWNKL